MYQQYPYMNYTDMASFGDNSTNHMSSSNGRNGSTLAANYEFNFGHHNNRYYNNIISSSSQSVSCYDFLNNNSKQQHLFYQFDSIQV